MQQARLEHLLDPVETQLALQQVRERRVVEQPARRAAAAQPKVIVASQRAPAPAMPSQSVRYT